MSEYQYFVTNFLCPHCESKTPIRKIINEQDRGDLDWFYHIGQCMNQECQKFIMFVYKRDPKGPSVLHPSPPIPVILVHHQFLLYSFITILLDPQTCMNQ